MPEPTRKFAYEPPVIYYNQKMIRPTAPSENPVQRPAIEKPQHRDVVIKLIHFLKSL